MHCIYKALNELYLVLRKVTRSTWLTRGGHANSKWIYGDKNFSRLRSACHLPPSGR